MRRYLGTMMIPLLAALAGCGGEPPSSSEWSATLAVKSPVLYVDAAATGLANGTSWADAFTDLQSALDAAVAGDEIWVAASATPYKPQKTIGGSTDPRMASFVLKSGVKLYGGFAGNKSKLDKRVLDQGATVLSGDIGTLGDATDNSFHVIYADGVTDAVLDGFTVTGGHAAGGPYEHCSGGGMYTKNSLLTVSNCVFSANTARLAGGGMSNHDSTLTVSACVFSGNQAGRLDKYGYDGRGGGMYNAGSYAGGLAGSLITDCTFRENLAYLPSSTPNPDYGGGGMYNLNAPVTVDRCTFERNRAWGFTASGGGMLNKDFGDDDGMPRITNCVFDSNMASDKGGAVMNFGPSDILSCTFYRNNLGEIRPGYFKALGNLGGAIYQFGMGSHIIGNIFSENVTKRSGAAIHVERLYYDFYGITISKCLFYENRGNFREGYAVTGASSVIDHFGPDAWTPDVSDWLVDVDPLLADPENGDFHLLAGSPAIDASVTKAEAKLMETPLPETDFDGDKRIHDGDGTGDAAADIGADEYVLE